MYTFINIYYTFHLNCCKNRKKLLKKIIFETDLYI